MVHNALQHASNRNNVHIISNAIAYLIIDIDANTNRNSHSYTFAVSHSDS
jgi:hypothetical protein